jgi:hypothetical protein
MERKSKSYSFNEKLRGSKGENILYHIVDILMGNIPGALQVIKSNLQDDLAGVDIWVSLYSGERIGIDCKIRDEDWSVKTPSRDDLALETWSVVEENIVGWTLDVKKKADYILWFWTDTGRWCLIPFLMLNHVFRINRNKWIKIYQVSKQHTPEGNYHSECVFVPRKVVWEEIVKNY